MESNDRENALKEPKAENRLPGDWLTGMRGGERVLKSSANSILTQLHTGYVKGHLSGSHQK
jgi:hypothetical protein